MDMVKDAKQDFKPQKKKTTSDEYDCMYINNEIVIVCHFQEKTDGSSLPGDLMKAIIRLGGNDAMTFDGDQV